MVDKITTSISPLEESAKINEIIDNASAINTSLSSKADTDLTNVSNTSGFRKLSEIYNNGTSWYKVFDEYNPSTGAYVGKWCEQGGRATTSSITFLKQYTDDTYNLTTSVYGYNALASGVVYAWVSGYVGGMSSKSATGFSFYDDGSNYRSVYPIEWHACGYIS